MTKASLLRGWKEIAEFLGTSTRSVRRWEREKHMPVRRLGTGSREQVFADPTELEAWFREQSGSLGTDMPLPATPPDGRPAHAWDTAAG